MRSPVIMIIVYVILSLIVDSFITKNLRHNSRKIKLLWYISITLLYTLLITALSLPARGSEELLLAKMWCLFTWISFFSIKIILVIFSLIGKIPRIFHHSDIPLGRWLGLPIGILSFIFLWIGALSTRHHIQVMHVNLEYPSLPKAYDGYTIAQISDLHLGTWGSDTTFISNLVDSVNALHPNLIVFTGDIVNRHTPEAYPFKSVLSRLKAPDGIIAILGNHDYGMYYSWKSPEEEKANMTDLKNFFHQIGWSLLANQHTFLYRQSDSIAVIGVENWGEPPFNELGDLTKALKSPLDTNLRSNIISAYDNNFKILLTHNPEHWRRKIRKESNIALTLSGHTHGMQMEMRIGKRRISPAIFRYTLWGGLYRDNDNPIDLYVNIGAGTVGLPFRLGYSIPEITLIKLYQNPTDQTVLTPVKKVNK